jgi:hypothetical protein
MCVCIILYISPLLFNSALEYVIRKVQANYEGLNVNATHQLLVSVYDVNWVKARIL